MHNRHLLIFLLCLAVLVISYDILFCSQYNSHSASRILLSLGILITGELLRSNITPQFSEYFKGMTITDGLIEFLKTFHDGQDACNFENPRKTDQWISMGWYAFPHPEVRTFKMSLLNPILYLFTDLRLNVHGLFSIYNNSLLEFDFINKEYRLDYTIELMFTPSFCKVLINFTMKNVPFKWYYVTYVH